MTPGDFTWAVFTTCAALFLLWPMVRATWIVDKTGDNASGACALVCVGLVATAIHGVHSLWWAATHGLAAAAGAG